jgi:hypothetical protein
MSDYAKSITERVWCMFAAHGITADEAAGDPDALLAKVSQLRKEQPDNLAASDYLIALSLWNTATKLKEAQL